MIFQINTTTRFPKALVFTVYSFAKRPVQFQSDAVILTRSSANFLWKTLMIRVNKTDQNSPFFMKYWTLVTYCRDLLLSKYYDIYS